MKNIATCKVYGEVKTTDRVASLLAQFSGKSKQDAIEHFVTTCAEYFLDAQPIVDEIEAQFEEIQG